MQGRSADNSKHAIPSIRKQRIIVTFTKSLPKKSMPVDGQRVTSSAGSQASHWGPPPSRSPNHLRHSVPKHYAAVPNTGVLPAPAGHPQIPPPNGIQPLFVATPVAPAMPLPPPVPVPPGTNWAAGPLRHPPPRFAVPGTGVFLPPPGSGNVASLPQLSAAASEMSFTADIASQQQEESGFGRSSNETGAPPTGKSQGQECNGSLNSTGSAHVAKEEQHTAVNKPSESA